jgi:hypothetical protein
MNYEFVESSNIGKIGFESGVIGVIFKDGAEYQYPNSTAADFAEFRAAKSKGRWLNSFIVKRAGGVRTGDGGQLASTGAAIPADIAGCGAASGATIKQDEAAHITMADGCCRVQLGNASLSGLLDRADSFDCGTCGTNYKPRFNGPLVVWEAQADVLIFKP